MARKVIGPKGSRRRHWLFLVCLVAAIGAAIVAIPSALAVHNLGVFELEGNAINQATAGDDWDNVCYSVAKDAGQLDATAAANCFANGDPATPATSNAKAYSWTSDCLGGTGNGACFTASDKNATIFTGGGSKDPQNITSWLWKDGAGGLPDKDNLEHAFAARYTVDSTHGTPANCGTDAQGNALTSCDVIYFGSDRFDNSGDAQQGFWFLQNEVTTGGAKSGGGNAFTGSHKCGDLLVISDFANGGTHQVINVYKWVDNSAGCTGYPGDVAPNLRLLSGTDPKTGNADCSVAPTNDAFCGTISSGGEIAPWNYTDKSGNSGSYLQGELFEAGVNLSSPQINLGGECFATVVSETRSSTSPTATLKDFVVGRFGKCTSETTTNQHWTPTDDASVNVVGQNTWAGTVSWKLYDGGDCGKTHTDGTANTATNTLYTASTNVDNTTTFPVSTTSTALVPDASGLTTDANGAYSVSWLVKFTPDTTTAGKGVPASTRCEATTGINIQDDVSHS